MKRGVRNVAASKRERLANRARSGGDPFDLVVRRFFFERFLYRLSMSTVADRFVLKGAMLFQLWAPQPYRATADLDLLRKGPGDEAALLNDMRSRETVIAEKVEAMVTLGIRNSRIKDFFDLHYLASHFDFDGATVSESMRRTFKRRKTPFPAEAPIALTAEFWADASRAAQPRAFARRARFGMDSVKPDGILPLLIDFLGPLLESLYENRVFAATWKAGGSWIQ